MFNIEEKRLLLDLFHLYAPSGHEEPVLNFIKDFLNKHNINFEQDDFGNIYCLNYQNQPLLSAHTDCVGTEEAGYYVNFIDLYPYGDDEILKGIGNIGADDKCGVFLILLYLAAKKPINAVFSICEEIGGSDGIKHLMTKINNNEIFKTIPYCLVLDRKNGCDIICSENDYGSDEFEKELSNIGADYGYRPIKGGVSDMNTIKEYMNGCNLSVGYYNPHSNTEFVSMNELYNIWEYLNDIIDNLPRDIKMKERIPESPTTYPKCVNYDSWNTWNDYNYSHKGFKYRDWDW